MRIDLALVTRPLAERITWAVVDRNARKGQQPSDHAPLLVDFVVSGPTEQSAGSDEGTPVDLRIGGLVAVLAIVLVVVLVTREDDDSEGAADTTTTIVTTTTVAPPPRPPPPSHRRPPRAGHPHHGAVPADHQRPQSYAKYLFVSWQNANQQEAAKVASADAVNQMFSQAYSPQTPGRSGCATRRPARCSAPGRRRTAPRSP